MNFLRTNTEFSVHARLPKHTSHVASPVDAYVTVLGKANNNQLLLLQHREKNVDKHNYPSSTPCLLNTDPIFFLVRPRRK
jgi:hypothetical protein